MTLHNFVNTMIDSEIIEATQDIIITEHRHSNNIVFNGKAMDIYYGEDNTEGIYKYGDAVITSINAENNTIYISVRNLSS